MTKHCKVCGNKLTLTDFNLYFCANCGILPMNNYIDEEESEESPSYIG